MNDLDATTKRYLDPATLAAVGSLELRARMIVEGVMIGLHTSPYQGFSIEFAQHRQYAPGDDIRHLDWKVFGRTDKLYLKQYQKETNLDLHVMVDVSGSMAYGSKEYEGKLWRKFDHAASIAAAICYLALQQQDRVALTVFADDVRAATRLSNAYDQWRRIVEVLSGQELTGADVGPALADGKKLAESGRATMLARMFEQVAAKLNRRSLVVVVSDLFDEPGAVERGLAMLFHRRHDVLLLQTVDGAELDFPFRGSAQFVGLEAEGRLGLDPAALRQAYQEVIGEHNADIERIARRFHFDHLLVDATRPLGGALSHFLARRAAKLGKAIGRSAHR